MHRPLSTIHDCHGRDGGISMLGRALLAVVLVNLLVPGVALAKRVAIPSSDGAGKGDGAVSAKVTRVLKQHRIQVVAPAQVTKATRRDGIPSGEDGWVVLARKLKVDGFVQLTFSATGAKRNLDVVVRNGADGSVVEQRSFTAKGAPKALAAVVGASLWKQIALALAKTAAPKKEQEGSNGMAPHALAPASEPEASGSKPEKADVSQSLPADSERPAARAPAAESLNAAGGEEESEPRAEAAPRAVKKRASAKTEPASDEEEGERRESVARLALDIEVDARLLQRTFSYVPSTAAEGYTLNFVPLVGARANWYPAAHAGRGWASNLGLRVSFEYGTWLKTASVYSTGTSDLVVGPQVRIPFSAGQLSFSAAFFRHAFVALDSGNSNDPARVTLTWPNTVYLGARIGAGARINLGWSFVLGLDAGYRLVTAPGAAAGQVRSSDYFPDGKVSYAGDGAAFLGFRLASMLEARAGADYRYYRLTSLQGPVIQANGAVDQYLAITVGLAGVIGGE
jgi:hypothetical protein